MINSVADNIESTKEPIPGLPSTVFGTRRFCMSQEVTATVTITRKIEVPSTPIVSVSVRVESIVTTLTSTVTEYIYKPSGSSSSSQDVRSHSAQFLHTGMIMGITVSAVFAAGLGIAIMICYLRRKRRGEPFVGRSLLWRGTRHRSSVDSQSPLCSQPRASCLPTHEHAPLSQSAPRSKRESITVRSPIDADLERDDPDTSGTHRSGSSGVPSFTNATAHSPDSDAPPFYTRCTCNLPRAHENLVHASFDGVAERHWGEMVLVGVFLLPMLRWRIMMHGVRLVLFLLVSLHRTRKHRLDLTEK
ncbi:hypothetical protein C8Q74DRAFT_980652 [Fomes fomentarius]|nr:hypothetical protein C8Q74DRAFT_980652 [Fomes fomentarius]